MIAPNTRTAALVAAFAALAVLLGTARALIWQAPIMVAFDLAAAKLPVTAVGGLGWAADLHSLAMGGLADDPSHPLRSRMVVLEDGKLLSPHASSAEIATEPGHFSHFIDRLTLSTVDGRDPTSNGHRYTVVAQVPLDIAAGLDAEIDQRAWDTQRGPRTAFVVGAGLLLIGCAILLAGDPDWRRLSSRWRAGCALLLFAAAGFGLALDAGAHWRDFKVSGDTVTYQVAPGAASYRLPGYWAFGRALVGPKWHPAAAAAFPRERTAPPAERFSPLLRVTKGQKVLAIVAVLLLGAALSPMLTAPIGAAVAALVGNFSASATLPEGTGSELFYFVLAAMLVWLVTRLGRNPRDWRRALGIFAGLAAGAAAAVSLIHFGLTADSADWVMSEGLATPLALLVLAGAIGYVYRGPRWMLGGAALAAGALYLTRPSDVYFWILVLGLLPVAIRRSGWSGARGVIAAVLGCFALLVVAPTLVQARISRMPSVPERHLLTFATVIAEPSDRDLMPDDEARAYLDRVLPRMAEARTTDPRFRGPTVPYFDVVAYEIAWPTAVEVVRSTHVKQIPKLTRALAAKMYRAMLWNHFHKYLGFVLQDLPELEDQVRTTKPVCLPVFLLVLAAAAASAPWRTRYLVLLLAATALAGALLPLLTTIPIARLVAPVDALLLVTLLVLCGEAVQALVALRRPVAGRIQTEHRAAPVGPFAPAAIRSGKALAPAAQP